jgi:hypothetical protein
MTEKPQKEMETKEVDNKAELLSLLNMRADRAERFTTSEFIESVKRDINGYEAKSPNVAGITGITTSRAVQDALNSRYDYVIPMIFTNTEAAKAELFDRIPDLIFKGRGQDDDVKKEKIDATYEYLKDKLDLESFAWSAAHWFILSGFVSATIGYDVKTHKEKVYDPESQEELMDETGSPVMRPVYDNDDPTIEVDNPLKTFFAPSSEFDIDASKVDYKVWWSTLGVEEIKDKYGIKLEGNYTEEFTKDGDEKHPDCQKVKTYFYCGTLPEEMSKLVEDWEAGAIYYIIFTTGKILFSERKPRKSYKLCRWYSQPNKFFGFGFGAIGAQFQKEKSTRVGQRIRLADVAAYPKYAVKNDGKNKIDPGQLKDPRELVVIPYETDAPSIIQPGDLSNVVTAAEQSAESDAQAAFGMLDISSGAQQSSTVKTATGQTIFAEAAARRLRQAKRLFMKFYRACVIELFKQCQENWNEEKLISITDADGVDKEIAVSKYDLQDIDFDKDLDIDAESVSVNKDVVRQQMIDLYDKVKDDPMVKRDVVFKDMLRIGFNQQNPARYIKESMVAPGTPLVNPQTGEQFVIGEGGDIQPAQPEMPTEQSSEVTPAPTQPGISGGVAGQAY